jgi:hypothetical protein
LDAAPELEAVDKGSMTQRDEGDSERAGGGVVTSPSYPQWRGEVATGSLSAALELVRELRFDVAQLRLRLEHDVCENVHASCMQDG